MILSTKRGRAFFSTCLSSFRVGALAFLFIAFGYMDAFCAELTVETSRPALNVFSKGETLELLFNAAQIEKPEELLVDVVDFKGVLVERLKLSAVPDGNGAWRGSAKLKAEKLGAFRVYAKLSDGSSVKALGSRPGGFITYGVTFDPASRRAYPLELSYFGMQGRADYAADIAPVLGVRWVLGPSRWRNTEPERPGQFAQSCADLEKKGKNPFDNNFERDFEALGKRFVWKEYPVFKILGGNYCLPAKWKNAPNRPGGKDGWGVLTPEGETAFKEYCAAFAKAIVKSFPDLPHRYYEVIWEPEIGLNGRPEDIVRYLEIAYPVIHQIDPKAVVMGPNIATLNSETMELTKALMSCGMGNSIDVFSIHPYLPYPPEKKGIVSWIRQLRSIVNEGAGRSIPFVCTEFGKSDNGTDQEVLRKHAAELVRQNLIMLGEGFQFSLAFYGVDNVLVPNVNSYGYMYNLDPERLYLPRKTSPKPQAMSFAAMTYILNGARSIGPVDWLGSSTCAYAYSKEGQVVLALWDFGDEEHDVVLPVGNEAVTIYDSMGNAVNAAPKDGCVVLTVGEQPVYVAGVSKEIWGEAALKRVSLMENRLKVFPGDRVTLRLSVNGLEGDELKISSGALKVLPQEGHSVIRDPKELSQRSFLVEAPADLAPGTRRIDFLLYRGGRVVGGAAAEVELMAPLEIDKPRPCLDPSGSWRVILPVKELSGRNASGSLSFKIAGLGLVEAKEFALKPGESALLEFPLPGLKANPALKYSCEIACRFDGGGGFVQAGKVNFLAAPAVPLSFGVGASQEEWKRIPSVILPWRNYRSGNQELGPKDKAEIKLAWNSRALFLKAKVRDGFFDQGNPAEELWKGDSLQCGLCLEPWMKFDETSNGLADEAKMPRQVEIGFALIAGDEVARRFFMKPSSSEFPSGTLSASACPRRIALEGDVLSYEAELSWRSLGLLAPPLPGSHLGIALQVNDSYVENGTRSFSSVGLYQGAGNKKDRELMGVLFLDER